MESMKIIKSMTKYIYINITFLLVVVRILLKVLIIIILLKFINYFLFISHIVSIIKNYNLSESENI